MNIAVASDHRGYYAKQRIIDLLKANGHNSIDLGCTSEKSCDYPDMAIQAAEAVRDGQAECAVMLCGTGLGMSMAANKVRGVRAALCHDELTAQYSRKHNDANVLCLPADLVGEQLMRLIVETWIKTGFEGGRHARRVKKITDYEVNNSCPAPA